MRLLIALAFLFSVVFAQESTGTDARNIPQVLFFQLQKPYSTLKPYLKECKSASRKKIASLLKLSVEDIKLSALYFLDASSSYYYFRIHATGIDVWDSIMTPIQFEEYKTRWERALLESDGKLDLELQIQFAPIDFSKSNSKHEYLPKITDIVKDEDSPHMVTSYKPTDIEAYVVKTHPTQMQFKLKVPKDTLKKTYSELHPIIDGVRTGVATVTAAEADDLILTHLSALTPDTCLVRFTIYPTSTYAESLKKWQTAITHKDPILAETFKGIDFSFAALYTPHGMTPEYVQPSEPEPDIVAGKSSMGAGVVIGSVLGAVAGLAIVGGVGYYAKKRMDANRNDTTPDYDETYVESDTESQFQPHPDPSQREEA